MFTYHPDALAPNEYDQECPEPEGCVPSIYKLVECVRYAKLGKDDAIPWRWTYLDPRFPWAYPEDHAIWLCTRCHYQQLLKMLRENGP